MVDINEYAKKEKEQAAMKEINSDPVRYTRIFTAIYQQLCKHCRAKVIRHYLKKSNMSFNEYCPTCKEMAEKEYNK
jgi:excinuclease UvrABC ATPase subunit